MPFVPFVDSPPKEPIKKVTVVNKGGSIAEEKGFSKPNPD
jgi:hypothetical protein